MEVFNFKTNVLVTQSKEFPIIRNLGRFSGHNHKRTAW